MHPTLCSRTRILLFSLSLLPFSDGISQLKPPKFEARVIDDAVEIGYGIAIGDVDGDGADDILLADKRQISWYRSPNW
jgi:hypothetical protein